MSKALFPRRHLPTIFKLNYFSGTIAFQLLICSSSNTILISNYSLAFSLPSILAPISLQSHKFSMQYLQGSHNNSFQFSNYEPSHSKVQPHNISIRSFIVSIKFSDSSHINLIILRCTCTHTLPICLIFKANNQFLHMCPICAKYRINVGVN